MMKPGKKGFSLTELLVALVIIVIIVGTSAQLFIALNKNYRIVMGYLSSYLKGREVVDLMSKDCRISIRVLDDYSSYTTDDSTLVLKAPSIDAAGDIVDVNTEFDHIIYYIQNDDLMKVVVPGSASSRAAFNGVMKPNVESLYLTSNGVPFSSITNKSEIKNITMHIGISETVAGKKYTVSPGTTVKLMNYEWAYVR